MKWWELENKKLKKKGIKMGQIESYPLFVHKWSIFNNKCRIVNPLTLLFNHNKFKSPNKLTRNPNSVWIIIYKKINLQMIMKNNLNQLLFKPLNLIHQDHSSMILCILKLLTHTTNNCNLQPQSLWRISLSRQSLFQKPRILNYYLLILTSFKKR